MDHYIPILLKIEILKKNSDKLQNKNLEKKKILDNFFFKNLEVINLNIEFINSRIFPSKFIKKNIYEVEKFLFKISSKILKKKNYFFDNFFFYFKKKKILNCYSNALRFSNNKLNQISEFSLKRIVTSFHLKLITTIKKNSSHPLLKYFCGLGFRKKFILVRRYLKFFFLNKKFVFNIFRENYNLENLYDKYSIIYANYFLNLSNTQQLLNKKKFKKFVLFFKIFLIHHQNFYNHSKNIKIKINQIINCKERYFQLKNSKFFKLKNFFFRKYKVLKFEKKFDMIFSNNIKKIRLCKDFIRFFTIFKNFYTNFSKRKIFIRSLKNIIINKHEISKIIEIQTPYKKIKNFYQGKIQTSFDYFSEKRNFSNNNFKFNKTILKNIKILPAKIIAVYPKIYKVNVKVNPEKNFYFDLNYSEKINFFQNYDLKIKNIFLESNYEKKFLDYIDINQVKIPENKNFFRRKKSGYFFFWNVEKFSFKISFLLKKKKIAFFSYSILFHWDSKIKEFIYIFEKKIFFLFNEFEKKFCRPLEKISYLLSKHSDFVSMEQKELEKKFILNLKMVSNRFFFKFSISDSKNGCFFFIYGFEQIFLKDFFYVNHRGFQLRNKTFSSINSIKKFLKIKLNFNVNKIKV